MAGDRLQAIYEKLASALFACNRRWRPWRSREMAELLELPWQPANVEDRLLRAAVATGHDRAAFEDRAAAVRGLFEDMVKHLVDEGLYGSDPISERQGIRFPNCCVVSSRRVRERSVLPRPSPRWPRLLPTWHLRLARPHSSGQVGR